MKKKKNMETFARKCSHCGKVFNEGFLVNQGDEYYCSTKCLHKHYTPKEWEQMSKDVDEFGEPIDNDFNYWTVWEDEDDMQYYADGTEVEE
jgi:hypothetical protein